MSSDDLVHCSFCGVSPNFKVGSFERLLFHGVCGTASVQDKYDLQLRFYCRPLEELPEVLQDVEQRMLQRGDSLETVHKRLAHIRSEGERYMVSGGCRDRQKGILKTVKTALKLNWHSPEFRKLRLSNSFVQYAVAHPFVPPDQLFSDLRGYRTWVSLMEGRS